MSDNTLTSLSESMAEAVERAGKTTVLVDARRRHPASGILYKNDFVITADHVIERDEDIKVMLADGRELGASLAGRDPGSDIALLKLNQSASGSAETAGGSPRVGQIVLALGRPTPEGIQASLGVISSMGGPLRTGRGAILERYLTTDAIPYPGFSGGPLVDAAGKVVGLNTSGVARGASIAIPASLVWSSAEALSTQGKIKRGYLGIRSQPVELPGGAQGALGCDQKTGLLLMGVERESPAAAAGLMVGDILVGIGGNPVSDHDELLGRLTGSLVGTPAQVEILRGGQPMTLSVTVGERQEYERR